MRRNYSRKARAVGDCYNPSVKPWPLACIAFALLTTYSASATLPTQSAPIIWQDQAMVAGELLKVRAGYEVALELAKPGATWELRAGGTAIPASLVGIVGAETATKIGLPFTQSSSAVLADLTIVSDQGLILGRMNTLRFNFSGMSLKCSVRFETSADGKTYKSVGREQVLYQEVSQGKIISLLDAAVDFVPQKYLRMTFAGARGSTLKDIVATFTPQPVGQREVPVMLGAMVTAADKSAYIWPLQFSSTRDFVTRLDLQADAPGTAREVAIAALDSKMQPQRTIARAVWADRITAGGSEHSQYGIAVGGLAPGLQYGVVVKASNPPFPLTAVKAYTNDAWLVFYAPEKTDLMLMLNPVTKYNISHPQYDAAKAREAGAVGPLICLAAQQVVLKPELRTPSPVQAAQKYVGRWWRTYAYGICAVVLALLAGALLRKRSCPEED
jgi:hypothetical protein